MTHNQKQAVLDVVDKLESWRWDETVSVDKLRKYAYELRLAVAGGRSCEYDGPFHDYNCERCSDEQLHH